MFELIGKAFNGLVSAYQEKAALDFLAAYPQIAGMVIGAVIIIAVILPVGPEWFRSTKIIGVAIMCGGLFLMVGGFTWAGLSAAVDAAEKLRNPPKQSHSAPRQAPIVTPGRDTSRDFTGG